MLKKELELALNLKWKNRKEYYLNEQMNAIQRELGQKDDGKTDIQELEEKLERK